MQRDTYSKKKELLIAKDSTPTALDTKVSRNSISSPTKPKINHTDKLIEKPQQALSKKKNYLANLDEDLNETEDHLKYNLPVAVNEESKAYKE